MAAPRVLVRTVADAVLRDFTNAPPFDWGEGVLLAGMMRAHACTGDDRYRRFVERFAQHWAERGIAPLLKEKGYCGHWGPAFPLIELQRQTGDTRAGKLANEVIDFLLHKAERTQDGGLSHFNGQPQLWVDTLFMCCPVLSPASQVASRPDWQSESVRQLEIFARHLQDPATGFFYHMWDEKTAKRTTAFWGRGNGWVAMALTEALKYERADSSSALRLKILLRKQLEAIIPLQDRQTGLWHTVLDAPDTYLETSATAMFLYAMAECRNRKLMVAAPDDVLRRAWLGLGTQVDPNGRIVGVSAGTKPGDKAHYAKVPQGTFTWGTGALLMAACACAELGLK